MGLEPVWKTHGVVLVSDGGATFDPRPDAGTLGGVGRYLTVQGRQASAIRKRWLIANYEADEYDGAYIGIGSAPRNYERAARGYSKPLVDDVISEVRTDLDYFSEAEAAVLQNHGYLLADVALRRHAPHCAMTARRSRASHIPLDGRREGASGVARQSSPTQVGSMAAPRNTLGSFIGRELAGPGQIPGADHRATRRRLSIDDPAGCSQGAVVARPGPRAGPGRDSCLVE